MILAKIWLKLVLVITLPKLFSDKNQLKFGIKIYLITNGQKFHSGKNHPNWFWTNIINHPNDRKLKSLDLDEKSENIDINFRNS